MEVFYFTIFLICNLFFTYSVFEFNTEFSEFLRFSKKNTLFFYGLYFVIISALPLLGLQPCWMLFFLLSFILSFVHSMFITYRIVSVLSFILMQCSVYFFMVHLSAKGSLHLFAVPSFNASLGKIMWLCLSMLTLLVFRITINGIKRRTISLNEWLPRFCLLLTLLTITFFALILDINRHHRSFSFGKLRILAEVDHPDLLFYLSCFGLLVLNVLVIYLCDRSQRLKTLQVEKSLTDQQNQYYQKQISVLKSSEQAIRSLRHDMNNHLTAIRAMMGEEDQQAIDYLDHMLEHYDKSVEISTTGNILIDSLVNYKLQDYASDDLEISYHASIPEELPFNPWDLTVILGNLIDNATSAARTCSKGNRKIQFLIEFKKNCFIVKVTNTYNHNLRFSGGEISTTKDDTKNHGFGLRNVKKTVEKNEGIMSVNYSDTCFTVTIVLNQS